MEDILSNLTIKVSEGLYQINPQTSKLGKNIVVNSVTMIDEIGFEKFNFKKLGDNRLFLPMQTIENILTVE